MGKRHLLVELLAFAGVLSFSACPLTPKEAEFSEVQTGESGIASAIPPDYISMGKSVLGTTGKAVCAWNPGSGREYEPGQFIYNSSAPRSLDASKISVFEEAVSHTLPAGYRSIPDATIDHDGARSGEQAEETVSYVNRVTDSGVAWNSTSCGGPSFHSLEEMILDCKNKLGANTKWDGAALGKASEAVWKLVSRTGIKEEVWINLNSGLLMSSRVTTSPVNWCHASGASNSLRLTGENESLRRPNDTICSQQNYQRNGANEKPVSLCFEHPEFESDNVTGARPSGKAGLRTLGENLNMVVHWRLPTLNEYFAARNDGFQYVLPDAGANSLGFTAGAAVEWTATSLARAPEKAHGFSSTGAGNPMDGWPRASGDHVRCIGRVVPAQKKLSWPLHRLPLGEIGVAEAMQF